MKFGRLGSEKNNKKDAQKHERKLAKDLGGRATPNSGATDGAKGDVRFSKFLLDDKFTHSSAYSVTLKDLNKITREAYAISKEPLFTIWIRKGITKGYPDQWILVPKHLINRNEQETRQVSAKSFLVSAQILNAIYKRSLKEDLEPCILLQFFGVSLGVSNLWYLLPLNSFDKDFFTGET